ncbi:efflux transporter, outer membrane factor (OMF) lipoprotein, NodT family [Sphingomonas sp. NFR15]|nr:efflux transporter, outer membrane factor (OMF) lipoprotein, NodT family [Sphingomonas sp. NFR15]
MTIPTSWREQAGLPGRIAEDWWSRFDDPALGRLVRAALERNTDLLVAGARVEEARAQFRSSASRLSPSIGLDGGSARSRSVNAFGMGVDQSQAAGEVAITYEVDLFGRLSAASDASRKAFLATAFARDGTRISLIATVVSGYALLRGLDEQLAIVADTAKAREAELAVIRRRTAAGYGSQLELRQAEAAYEAASRLIPATRLSVSQQENALSVLVGGMPAAIDRGADLGALLRIEVPSALPSALVRLRPDVAEAEMRLASTDRSLDAARAEFLPNLQLSASSGAVASTLLSDPVSLFSIGGSILAPLFRGGELRAQADVAAARRDAAAFSYRGTVLKAFEEVDNAMTAVSRLTEEEAAIDRQILASSASVELARRRYRSGYASYLEQIDAERSLLETRLQRVSIRSARATAIVTLYRGLGGGWDNRAARRDGSVLD